MVVGLGLVGGVEFSVAVPFADVTGVVAGLFEEGGDGDFFFFQMPDVSRGDPVKYAAPKWGSSGEHAGAGG